MSRYIDIDHERVVYVGGDGDYSTYNIPDDIISYDVIDIVRCKDCKFDETCCRNIRSDGRKPEDFCSEGRREYGKVCGR